MKQMRRNIILILLSLFLVNVYGQKVKKSTIQQVVITSTDSVIYAYTLNSNPKKLKVDNSKKYFWYYSNSIQSNKGGFSGRLLHGKYEVKDADGRLLRMGSMANGLMEGEWKKWNEDGNLVRSELWESGELRNFKVYNSRGQLVREKVLVIEKRLKDKKTDKEKEKKRVDKKKTDKKNTDTKNSGKKPADKEKKFSLNFKKDEAPKEKIDSEEGFFKKLFSKEEKDTAADKPKKEKVKKDKKEKESKKEGESWFKSTISNIKEKFKKDEE